MKEFIMIKDLLKIVAVIYVTELIIVKALEHHKNKK